MSTGRHFSMGRAARAHGIRRRPVATGCALLLVASIAAGLSAAPSFAARTGRRSWSPRGAAAGNVAAGGDDAAAATAPGEVPPVGAEATSLARDVESLARGSEPPPWATDIERRLDRRTERLLRLEERVAARLETPVPRLDEPVILLTVAAAAGILGYALGRLYQRRRDRGDGRFRL